jgi:hypothetical protein
MTESPSHPISLETVVFTKSFVQAVPEHEPPTDGDLTLSIQPENKISVTKVEGKAGAYAATMSSVFNPTLDKSAPYYFDMECMAMLHADSTLSEDEALRGITITAHQVLYGAIREAVAWGTGRQVYGPMVLGLSVLAQRPASKEPSDAPE